MLERWRMHDLIDALEHIAGQPLPMRLLKVAAALLLFFVGWRLAKVVVRAEHRLLLDAHIDAAPAQFLRNATYVLLLAFVVVTGLELAGFPITSLLTMLGATAFAIGLALKDSVTNVAAGIILMVLRPFRIGDRVSLAGQQGIVEGSYIFETRLRGADDSVIVVMNGSAIAAPIINYSRSDAQRLTLSVKLGQDADLGRALQVASATLKADARLADTPPPELSVNGIGTSNAALVIHARLREATTEAARNELLGALHTAFRQQQISFVDKPSV